LNKLLALLIFFLLIPASLAVTINPSSISLSLKPGETNKTYLNITLENEECSLSINGTAANFISGLPVWISSVNLTTLRVPLIVSVPETAYQGTFSSQITYCNGTASVNVQVLQAEFSPCDLRVSILGPKSPGTSLKFDIRDGSYYRVSDATVNLYLSDGSSDMVDCRTGFCSWTIPKYEKNSIIAEVIVPECPPYTAEIDILPPKVLGGNLTFKAPSRVSGNFQIMVYTNEGPEKAVEIKIVGPEGYTFDGITNDFGVVTDYAGNVYGIDIVPDELGEYTVFAKKGERSSTFTFQKVLEECPYECCPAGGNYEEKVCPAGFECVNNECREIEKPKLKVECSPKEPKLFEEVVCRVLKDNKQIDEDVTATLSFNDKEQTIEMSSGSVTLKFERTGSFVLTVPDLDGYEGDSFRGEVKPPKIPLKLIAICSVPIVGVLVVIFIIRKRRKPKPRWYEPGSGSSSEYTVEEVIS